MTFSASGRLTPTVDVIIRTLARAERKSHIQRAIGSVKRQQDVPVRLLVVVNGNQFDPGIVDDLRDSDDVDVHYMEKASTGESRLLGRQLVRAPFFLFLDDDDELLPNALSIALAAMRPDPDIALVVTNGYYVSGETRRIDIPDLSREQADPLRGLIDRVWMSSCGGLFRTAHVSPDLFEPGDVCYHEWSLFAFKLALSGEKIAFLDVPTYNVYDTPGSTSKTLAHIEGELRVLDIMLSRPLPIDFRRRLEKKYRNALHVLANANRKLGRKRAAWRYHMKSMKPPSTLRYLLFTRKLLWARAE